jgi:hypothetical protein
MKPYPFDSANAKEGKPVAVLQASELTLNGGAAAVEAAPLVALARDARLAVAAVLSKRDDGHHVAVGALGVESSRRRSAAPGPTSTRSHQRGSLDSTSSPDLFRQSLLGDACGGPPRLAARAPGLREHHLTRRSAIARRPSGLGLLTQAQPLADSCHEISHGASLCRFASHFRDGLRARRPRPRREA